MKKTLLKPEGIHSFSTSPDSRVYSGAANLSDSSSLVAVAADGEGLFLYDIEDKKILDCVSMSSKTRFACNPVVFQLDSTDQKRFFYVVTGENGEEKTMLQTVLVGATLNDHKFSKVISVEGSDSAIESIHKVSSSGKECRIVLSMKSGAIYAVNFGETSSLEQVSADPKDFTLLARGSSDDGFYYTLSWEKEKISSLVLSQMDADFTKTHGNYRKLMVPSSSMPDLDCDKVKYRCWSRDSMALHDGKSFYVISWDQKQIIGLNTFITEDLLDFQYVEKNRIVVFERSGTISVIDLKFRVILDRTEIDNCKGLLAPKHASLVVLPCHLRKDRLVVAIQVDQSLYIVPFNGSLPPCTLASVIASNSSSSSSSSDINESPMNWSPIRIEETLSSSKNVANLSSDTVCALFDRIVSLMLSDNDDNDDSAKIDHKRYMNWIGQLLESNLVSDWKCSVSLSQLIAMQNHDLRFLELIIRHVQDIKEENVVDILALVLQNCDQNIVATNDEDSEKFKFLSMILSLQMIKRSPSSLVIAVSSKLGPDATVQLLDVLVTWLKRHGSEICPGKQFQYPNLASTLSWIKILLDSKYSSIVLDVKLAARVKHLASIVKRELGRLSETAKLHCQLNQIVAISLVAKAGQSTIATQPIISEYCIEHVDL